MFENRKRRRSVYNQPGRRVVNRLYIYVVYRFRRKYVVCLLVSNGPFACYLLLIFLFASLMECLVNAIELYTIGSYRLRMLDLA